MNQATCHDDAGSFRLLTPGERHGLNTLSEAAGGWVVFEKGNRRAFVPIDEWRTRFESWREGRKRTGGGAAESARLLAALHGTQPQLEAAPRRRAPRVGQERSRETIRCPKCGGRMVFSSRSYPLAYKTKRTEIDVQAYWCTSCDEGILEGDALQQTERAFQALKRLVDEEGGAPE